MSYKTWLEQGRSYRKGGGYDSHQNAFLGILDDKEVFHNLNFGPCHGGLQEPYKGRGYTPKVIYSWKMNRVAVSTDEREAFYTNWLIKESPWSKAFISKSWEEVLEEGYKVKTDLPSDYVASACVATRFYTESHNNWIHGHVNTFEDLLDKGVDPLWAFTMSQMYKRTKDGYSYQMQSGHELVPQGWSKETVKKFLKGDYNPGESFAKRTGYSTIGTTFKAEGVSTASLAKEWGNLKVSAKDFNIFRRPAKSYPLLDIDGLLLALQHAKESING